MSYIKTAILLSFLTALFMAIGYLLSGTSGMIFAFFFALIMNGLSFWFSDSIVLKMTNATVADKNFYKSFYNIVEQQTINNNMPMPKLYVIEDNTPNDFATGRNPQNSAVAITTGIWNLLSVEELSGVIAHELAHIKNRDTLISTICATFAGAISMIAKMFMFMSLFGGHSNSENRPNPLVGIIVMIIAPLSATIIQMAVSRQREYEADKTGGNICGNPLYLASALSKLEQYSKSLRNTKLNPNTAHMYIINPFAGNGDNLFSTHPNTQNRIAQLQMQASKMGINSFNNTDNNKVNPVVEKVKYQDSHVQNNPWL